MNKKRSSLDYLRAFFEARPPFESVAELAGHAGSSIPDIFLAWLGTIGAKERAAIVGTLLHQLIVTRRPKIPLGDGSNLINDIVPSYPDSLTASRLLLLEQYMSERGNIRRWTQDREDDNMDHGTNYRERWPFALCLWNLLYRKGSALAPKLYSQFEQQARDAEFAKSLSLARRVIDSRGKRP